MVKTMPTDCVSDCGIDDLASADCARMTVTVVMQKGIFKNAFADEWTTSKPDTLARTAIIDHVINLCDLPADYIMVKSVDQQQWSTLEHVVSVGFEEVGEFFTVRDDGITLDDTLMLIHLHMFKAFLFYYKSKTCCDDGPTEDDVMLWTPKDFSQYCYAKAYHDDYTVTFPSTPLKTPNNLGAMTVLARQ
jgi:hypothetical protein